jgi:hypothetical protein
VTIGGGGIKNYQKLCDFIYGRLLNNKDFVYIRNRRDILMYLSFSATTDFTVTLDRSEVISFSTPITQV